MLHKPDVNTAAILDLANFMENCPPEKYNQATSCGTACCIWGWDMKRNPEAYRSGVDHKSAFMERLGIKDCYVFNDLVCAAPLRMTPPVPSDAAKVLRHLAVTGEVNWGVTGKAASDNEWKLEQLAAASRAVRRHE